MQLPRAESTPLINSQSPCSQQRKSLWKSEWDHSFKHRLNLQLTQSRQTFMQRVLIEEPNIKYFELFEKVPFEEYVGRTRQQEAGKVQASTKLQLRRRLKLKQFSLNKLATSPIEQQNDECHQHCFDTIKPYLLTANAWRVPTPNLPFERFHANNLKSIIQRQRVQEAKRLKPDNFRLATEFVQRHTVSSVSNYLNKHKSVKPMFRPTRVKTSQ